MTGWVGLVSWLTADGSSILMVTHKLQARESSPVRDRHSTTELHHKLSQSYISQVVQFVLRNIRESQKETWQKMNIRDSQKLTFGTCGLNSTARCIASTAFISGALRPRLDATSTENLHQHDAVFVKDVLYTLSRTVECQLHLIPQAGWYRTRYRLVEPINNCSQPITEVHMFIHFDIPLPL